MLLCFSSVTSAQVTVVAIREVWGDGIGRPLARPGGKVWVSAEVTVSGKPCRIYMGVKIGNTERDLEHVGAIQWNAPDTTTVTWSYTLEPNETDGVKDVTVTVRAKDMVNDTWYGPPMSVIRQNGFTVDGTGPYFGVWSPAGPIVNQTSCVFTVPISDGAGVDWTKLTSESVVVIGGALDSVERQGDNARVSVVSMNQAGIKSIVLTAWDSLGNSSTGRHNFTVADTIPPLMGEWVVDGVAVDDGVRILQNSPSFRMRITDDCPTSGIDSSRGVVVSIHDGEKYHLEDIPAIRIDDQYVTPLFWLPDDDYSLTFRATDGSGNQSSSTLDFTIDTVQPQLSNPDPAHGFETNNRGITPTVHITDPLGRLRPDATVWRMKDPDSLDVNGQATWSDPVSRFTPGSAAAPAPLPKDGIYSLEVYAEDEVGHRPVYPSSGAWQFLLDTVAPVVDSIDPNVYRRIGDHVYTARNGTDGKELELTVTVSDPGSNPSGFNARGTLDVEVYDSTDTLIPGQVSRDPSPRPDHNTDPWTATWKSAAVLPDGTYHVKILATDDAGNTLTSNSFEFMVDTTPPDVEGNGAEVGFLNNTNDRRFTDSRQVQVKWGRASDPSAGSAPGSGLLGYSFEIWTKEDGWTYDDGRGVKLYEAWTDTDSDDPSLGPPLSYLRPTGSPTEIWNGGPLGLESGKSYGAWIRAWDMLHNGSDWFDPPFIFDADPPTDPGAPEVRNPGAGWRTRDNMPKLKWAHSTDGREWAQSGVDLYEVEMARAVADPQPIIWDIYHKIDIPDEDVDKQGPDKPLTGDFEWTVPTPLADGKYIVRVRAKDVAGNYSSWAEIHAAFTIDTTPPETPGMPTTMSPTSNQNPVWTWAPIADAAGDFHHYNVYEDGAKAAQVAITKYTSLGLGPGLHTLEVTSVDDLGNESAKSTAGQVLIDTIAPEAPIMNPMPEYSRPGPITFSWSAPSGGREIKYRFRYSLDGGTTWNPAVGDLTVQSFTVDGTGLADGAVVAGQAMAYDSVGNESSYSASVSTTVDGTGPEVTMTNPTESVFTNAATFTYGWEATDAGCGVVHGYKVKFNGTEYLTFRPTWSGALAPGANALEVLAIDGLGNEGRSVAAPVVTHSTCFITRVLPFEGRYRINEISTVAFEAVGLHDAAVEVYVNSVKLDARRVVPVICTPALAKFYVLLDGEVMTPGMMTITIRIGTYASTKCDYTVDPERSGFGFGRLRPW